MEAETVVKPCRFAWIAQRKFGNSKLISSLREYARDTMPHVHHMPTICITHAPRKAKSLQNDVDSHECHIRAIAFSGHLSCALSIGLGQSRKRRRSCST